MIDVIQKLKKYTPAKILVDGALFRKTFASNKVTEAIILSTGASYHNDMEQVVKDTATIYHQFHNQEINDQIKSMIYEVKDTCIIDQSNQVTILHDLFIHTNMDVIKKQIHKETRYVYINGALTDTLIHSLIEIRHNINKLTIIVEDATHILCSSTLYNKLKRMNVDVKVLHKSEVLFVSYNPTSPYGYTFNDQDFKALLEKHIDTPIINVVKDRT